MAFLPVLRKKAGGVAEARHGCNPRPEKWGEKGLSREENHVYALLIMMLVYQMRFMKPVHFAGSGGLQAAAAVRGH